MYVSFESTPPRAAEQTGDWGSCSQRTRLGAPLVSGSAKIPTKTSGHLQQSSWLHSLPGIFIPSSHGAISLPWRSSRNKIHHVTFFNTSLFTWLLCSTRQSYPGSPASLRSLCSPNPVQSVALNGYLSNRKWNLKETRPPGKSRWKLLLMGHGANFWNKCFRTQRFPK